MHSCQALSPSPDDRRLSRTEGLSWAAAHGLEVVGNGSWNVIGIYGSHSAVANCTNQRLRDRVNCLDNAPGLVLSKVHHNVAL